MKLKKEIELLKKYGVTNYSIEDDQIVINGGLDLSSLTSVPDSNFLKGTTINGWLDLSSTINEKEQKIVKSNVKMLKKGYNKRRSYCYFDGILSKVIQVFEKKEYIVYRTPFEFIAQKGKFIAHGKTVKKAIQDLEFKIISEKIKKTPIYPDTKITVMLYRQITGACDAGCRSFMQQNNIPFKEKDGQTKELKPIIAKNLLPILEKYGAYGLDKFKELLIN